MDSPADFRKRAQDCLALIPRMSDASRPILLSIAEAWVVLANELEIADPEFPTLTGERADKVH
jgi:hypothetical protein